MMQSMTVFFENALYCIYNILVLLKCVTMSVSGVCMLA